MARASTVELSTAAPAGRMAYDNSTRLAKARETRRLVLAAAAAAFLAHGYAGTTIRAVAEEAGVSQETIYKTFRNKATLLKAVYDVTLAGDDEALPVPQRPEALAVRAAASPPEAAAAYARLARTISENVGPLLGVVLGARSTDADLDAFVGQIDHERLVGATMVTRQWGERGWLGGPEAVEQARDVVWTLNSPAVYQLLRDRGWSGAAYESWLAATLAATIFGGSPSRPRRPR